MGADRKSQHLESPGWLVFVVQTIRCIKVNLPRRRRVFVVQTLCGVEGEAGRRIRLVVLVRRVVVVPRWRANVVVRVSRHGAAGHGAELVVRMVVVGMHGRQIRAAFHATKIRA